MASSSTFIHPPISLQPEMARINRLSSREEGSRRESDRDSANSLCGDIKALSLELRIDFCERSTGSPKSLRDISWENVLWRATSLAAQISQSAFELCHVLARLGHGNRISRLALLSCCNWIKHYTENDGQTSKWIYSLFPSKMIAKIQERARCTQTHLARLDNILLALEDDLVPRQLGVSTIDPGTACVHRYLTACLLTSGQCCACADGRPMQDAYARYVDGEGLVLNARRWEHYCSSCRGFWDIESRRRPPQTPFPYRTRSSEAGQSDSKGKGPATQKDALRRSCGICSENKSREEFPSQVTATCDHDVQTCTSCIQQWIHSCLSSKEIDTINCLQCPSKLQYDDIRKHATKSDFILFDALILRKHLSVLPAFYWCLNPACSSGQLHDSTDGPIFTCSACGSKTCIPHGIPWHEGKTCDQFDREEGGVALRAEMEQSRRMIAKITKQCPGAGCGTAIEKHEGCDHMTCKKCKHEFCWLCSAPYEPIRQVGNSKHRNWCKYYCGQVD